MLTKFLSCTNPELGARKHEVTRQQVRYMENLRRHPVDASCKQIT